MRPPYARRDVLTTASAVGLGLLAGCQTMLSGENETSPSDTDSGDQSLGLAYSQSQAAFPSDQETHSGWVHIVSDGESADLTFEVRFCRTLGDVKPELTHAGGDEYVLRFVVSADFENGGAPSTETEESRCRSVTRLVGGGNVPRDWRTLLVEVNSTAIQTIERAGTVPELRPLPDPIH